jgi:hypothetical protein
MTENSDIITNQLNAAEAALAVISHPSHAADIADKAEAARVYAKRIGASLPVINRATAIKLKAERKAGEILAGIDKAKNQNSAGIITLPAMGITKIQSSRWSKFVENQ